MNQVSRHAHLHKRIEAARNLVATRSTPFDASSILFGPQRSFVSDAAPYKTAVCSRRAGKTVGCAASLLDSAQRKPGSVSMYLTLSRINAKQIVWGTLQELNRKHNIGAIANESDLSLKLPNGSRVILVGASDKREVDKRRGLPLGKVVVDEAQSFPGFLQELVDDVLAPALMDFSGTLDLIGTPSPVPVGYFYDCTRSKAWSHHSWTAFDNPHVKAREHLAKELVRRGVTEDDPSIRREFFGQWAYDPNALVFRWDASRNVFTALPDTARAWQHVIGVDLGFDDADAIAVLAFNDDSPHCYLVEEWVGTKQTVTALTDKLRTLAQRYDPLSIVVDTGGLGKKIAHEVTLRTGVPLKAAEKDRKFEFIELLNDAMRTSRFYAQADSRFAADALLVEWDRDKPEKLKISDRFHSDICDAVLYAFRESLHWLHVPPVEPTKRGSAEWVAEEERKLEEYAEEQLKKRLEDEGRSPEPLEDSSRWEWWATS